MSNQHLCCRCGASTKGELERTGHAHVCKQEVIAVSGKARHVFRFLELLVRFNGEKTLRELK